MRTYTRVIPRDLFNEADLLKCYGRLWILLETPRHSAELSDKNLHSNTPFAIAMDESDGSLTITNLPFLIKGKTFRLWRPMNSRAPWPLYCSSHDDETCERVFTDTGALSAEFLRLINYSETVGDRPVNTQTIGAKKLSTKDDLKATAAQIVSLSKRDPIAALQHPNCPHELWWKLAKTRPIQAITSQLYPLLLLESPDRWMTFLRENMHQWMATVAKSLPERRQRQFASDCAERALPFFEADFPNDHRPHLAIEAARDWASGESVNLPAIAADLMDHTLRPILERDHAPQGTSQAQYAAHSAYCCVGPVPVLQSYGGFSNDDESLANNAAGRAAMARFGPDAADPEVYFNEQLWQWNRLVSYAIQ